MKFYKVLQLSLILCFIVSCSQDTEVEEAANQPEPKIAEGQFDNSYLGAYKGLFTTEDGLTRGSVEVTLSPTNEGVATIILSSGEQFELKSSRVKLTANNTVSNLRFSSQGLSATDISLDFSVEGNGINPSISNVIFDNRVSDILIAKNLSRAPLTPITGTYIRTSGTGGFPTSGRTWNIMSIDAGDGQNFAVQIFYGGRVYTTPAGNNMQSNCVDGANLVSCDVAGSARILGHDVSWNGTHQYHLSPSITCSAVSGTWSSPTFGNSSGTFSSDSDVSACANTPYFPEVVIGTQTWMLKNLDVEYYSNGDPIPQVQDRTAWGNLTTGAWCYYQNDSANGIVYGKLYNWYAANDPRGLAPDGWHVATNAEWSLLGSFLGGTNVAGGKMKSTTGWIAPNTGATNESGFTGLPGGYRDATTTNDFNSIGSYGYWFGVGNTPPNLWRLNPDNTTLFNIGLAPFDKFGFSIRCVKD